MTATAGAYRGTGDRATRLGRTTLFLWAVAGVALLACAFFYLQPTRLQTSLGDTDDATRLVEVRQLIDGGSWFDNTLPRLGGAGPLQSHWSRLIDLPLAAMLATFEQVMPAAAAEMVVRIVWPLTLLLALLYFLGREADLRGGRWAGVLTILLAATCFTDIVQFVPGRIDHHNAMILCATIGILRLARSLDDPDAGWSAGALLGLGTAIGYESLALTIAALALSVLFGILPGRSLLGPSRATVTFWAALAIAFAATTAPDRFFVEHCDALSLNLVALAAIAATGVCTAQALERRLSLPMKLALLATAGVAGLLVYGIAEPACLAGPFGEVDRALFPIWLDRVMETQSLFSIGEDARLQALVSGIYLLIGIYAGAKLLRSEASDTLRFDFAILLAATLLSCWQVKLLPYATCLAVPLAAVWLTRPSETPAKPVGRKTKLALAGGALAIVGVAAALIYSGEPSKTKVDAALEPTLDCAANAAIKPLAELPPGLAVADVNLGPYLVALTRLDALSAPYHRLGPSILAANNILHAPAGEAETLLREAGARYVITCPGLDSTGPKEGAAPNALLTELLADKPPPFLEAVPLAQPTPLKVWRIVP
jgi:hypothetical protein